MANLPLGKLPPELLKILLEKAPVNDPRVILGPGIGLDCAVVALGDTCLVFKSDPITFTADEIGWYAVHVNANDIATTGAAPRWFLVTMLLPEGKFSAGEVEAISRQVYDACNSLKISVIGGHSEVTYNLDRPIIAGTMIGEVPRDRLVTPQGASPGDRILLTKGVPLEGSAILAREFPGKLEGRLTADEIETARNYLFNPGISVVRDAQLAVQAGQVTAMHDPTEGGVASALWELAEACSHSLVIDPGRIPVSPLSRKICGAFEIDPFSTLASGALLLTASPKDAGAILRRLQGDGITCVEIGNVEAGPSEVLQFSASDRIPFPRPERDEIGRALEALNAAD